MNSDLTRRDLLSKGIPAAALATAATVAAARPVADIPIRRREYLEPACECASGFQDVVCCTPAERTSLLAARPDMAAWLWLDFGDRAVGISRRPRLEFTTVEDAEHALRVALEHRRHRKAQA